jgi:ornithine cyclodeaminase/alanine dehydrogenase-like protein (mu-crystallin family)
MTKTQRTPKRKSPSANLAGVLHLTEADVAELLDMQLAVDCVEEAFRRLASGEASNVPRTRAQAPGIILHTMSAAAGYLGLLGWKCYTTTREGARFHVGLYDQTTGQLVALIEANRLGQLRTGATTAVAVQWMAPADATEVGLFGAGWQAEAQLTAVATARPLKNAFVYARNPEKRADFAERMTAALGFNIRPVDRPQEAAADLPIVITATTSSDPVFDGSWLEEGALVCAMGCNALSRAEIDATVVRRAETIVCDSVEACRGEAGDFVDAIEKGVFDWSRAVDLADVVTGRAVGRGRDSGVALFKSVGLAIEDVALAAKLLALAREAGRGTILPI